MASLVSLPGWRTLLLTGLLGLVGACHTGQRLWRITPFEDAPESDRVNLWPLAYHSGDQTSVLWPLFDVDDKGFALRPVVAKDGTGWSILFPLASFDTAEGTGWIFPFYRFDTVQGLFPLVNLGGFSWVGPAWWTDESRGLFPVAAFGSFNYVGPVWWRPGQEQSRGGLFPVAHFGSWGYVGPAWWSSQGYGLFPLFGIDALGGDVTHVGPLWWHSGKDGFDGGLFPLLHLGEHGRRFSLLPLYSHDLRPESRRRDFLLGLVHSSEREGASDRWALPLYYHRERGAKRDTALLPFFYKRVRGEQADVFTLVGNRSVSPDDTSLNIYPLWWSNRSADSSWKMLFPLFYFAREGDDRTLLTPLGGRGWNSAGRHNFTNVLGPIYHHSENLDRDEERTAVLWPLFESHRQGQVRETRVAGLWSRRATPDTSETSWAFYLGHHRRTAQGVSHRLWPLYSWSSEPERPDWLYQLTLYGRSRHGARTATRLFPLYSSTRDVDESEWNALLGLVHHDRQGDGSRRWWAWPLAAHSRGRVAGFADLTSLVGWSDGQGVRNFQLGASLLYSRTVVEREDQQRRSSHFLGLFSRGEMERFDRPVPHPEALSPANRVRRDWNGYVFGLFSSERATYRSWRAGVLEPDEARILARYASHASAGPPDREATLRVLGEHGVQPADDSSEALGAALRAFAEDNTHTFERRNVDFQPLWYYDRRENRLSWSAVLGLVRYDRSAERRRLRLLYYGYRSETRGERTTRDIFPFITLDTGPRETEWSFLWRLLHYERKGSRRGGHVLFIPIGDV